MKSRSVLYLCNALDEETKHLRNITTDSPAATKKVFGLCHALQVSNMNVIILSMGRGRQNGSGTRFSQLKKRVDDIQIVYASFWHIPLLTHIVTALSLMLIVGSLARKGKPTLLVYNRCWHYIPALCLAKLLRVRCYLDLEDGWVSSMTRSQRVLTFFYNWACNEGSLLACEALSHQVKTKNNLVCYGAVPVVDSVKDRWHQKESLQVLFGGSLCEGTGGQLFIEAIQTLIEKQPVIAHELHIVIVGFGEMSVALKDFSVKTNGLVEYRGEVSNNEYAHLLDASHIGLCLKLSDSFFHDSTFPSKVIEISSHGLLLLSTSVSDVPKVFSSDNAILLGHDSPECFANALLWVIQHRVQAAKMAEKGKYVMKERFSMGFVGSQLVDFLTVNDVEV